MFKVNNYVNVVLFNFKLGSSVSTVIPLRCRRVRLCSKSIVLGRSIARRREVRIRGRLSASGGMSIATRGLLGGVRIDSKRSSRRICLSMPGSMRTFGGFIIVQSQGAGRVCSLSSGKTVLARGMTGLLRIGINSGLAVSASSKRGAILVDTVYRGCVKRCLCVASRICRGAFNRTPTCGSVCCEARSHAARRTGSINRGVVGYSKALDVDCAADLGGRISRVLRDLSVIVIMLVVSTKVLTFMILCGLGGVGVARHGERLTALGMLKFCSGRISSCICERGVLLALVKTLTKLLVKGVLRHFVIRAIRVSSIVFKQGVSPPDFLCTFLLAITFSLFIGKIVCFGLGGVGVIRSLGDMRWSEFIEGCGGRRGGKLREDYVRRECGYRVFRSDFFIITNHV